MGRPTITEQIEKLRAQIEHNQKKAERIRKLLVQRHEFHYQAIGYYSPPPTVLHEFHSFFDAAMQKVQMDIAAQIREDEKTLAQLRGETKHI